MRRLVIALIGLLIVTGCTGSADNSSKDALPDGITTQALPPVSDGVLKKADYTVLGTLPGHTDGKQISYSGATADGFAYGAVVTGHSPTGAILTSLLTGKITYLAPEVDGPGHEVGGMAVAPDWVVWLDQFPADAYGSPHWRLFSYQRSAHKLRMLAASTVDQTSATYSQLQPTIMDGKVYLSAVKANADKLKPDNDAYVVPLDGSAPIKGLGWGSDYVRAGGGVIISTRGSKLVWTNMTTGNSEVAPGCDSSADDCIWGVGEGVLAYQPRSDDDDTTIDIIDSAGRRRVIDAFFSLPSVDAVSRRWLTFDDNLADEFVYDLTSDKIAKLPHGWKSLATSGGDETMTWFRGANPSATYEFVRLN